MHEYDKSMDRGVEEAEKDGEWGGDKEGYYIYVRVCVCVCVCFDCPAMNNLIAARVNTYSVIPAEQSVLFRCAPFLPCSVQRTFPEEN